MLPDMGELFGMDDGFCDAFHDCAKIADGNSLSQECLKNPLDAGNGDLARRDVLK